MDTPLMFNKKQISHDYSYIAPPKSPFQRTRMSSSVKRKSSSQPSSSSRTSVHTISYFKSHAAFSDTFNELTARDSGDNTDEDKTAEIRIIDENPYEDMFRNSINGCKKCNGNGILIPKYSNEPQICPKCHGHGYENDDVILEPINACGRCSIM